jgi:hypothetical protein
MPVEVTAEQAKEMMAVSREEMLIQTLKRLLAVLNEKGDDSAMISAVQQQSKAIEGFLVVLRKLSAKDNQNTLSLIEQLAEMITEGQGRIEEQLRALAEPREWEFGFKRNSNGFIQSPITAKQIK